MYLCSIKIFRKMVRVSKIIFCVIALFLVSCEKYEQEENDLTEVFIAHAGGKINGYTYTNSLEALDLSYSMGCKMFELDIIETSDSVFVAAHHWSSYKAISGYVGVMDETPLSEQEFLLYNIYGMYTPMNMTAINEWFAAHEDAILVTDKINEPKRFAEQFLFKNRLIMELFSWKAVNEALEIGVKAMPSENLIFGASDIEQTLNNLKIRHIAISRFLIAGNEELLIRLKNKGIKTYVYHVNDEVGKDEKYVFENELHLITGMYADDLSLLISKK